MAKFNSNSSKQASASLSKIVSTASGRAMCWVNFTDSFAKATGSKDAKAITADEAIVHLEVILKMLKEGKAHFESTDLTEERETISADEY